MTRKMRLLAGAAVLVAVTVAGGVVFATTLRQGRPAAQQPPAYTATVEKGTLSAMVSMAGTLTYRAQSDGSPYSVINRRSGIYTELPEDGDRVDCGGVLYGVDANPVVLLCGPMPAYRTLNAGERGPDVTELNTSLVNLGYATRAQLDPSSSYYSYATALALERLQSKLGEDQTGTLSLGQAVFLPEPVRIAIVNDALGGSAAPGEQILTATSDTPEVQVELDPSYQGEVVTGAAAQITLPDNTLLTGKVDRLSRVAQVPAGQNNNAGQATIPAFISLDNPDKVRGLDRAPLRVAIAIGAVEDALTVPVTALVGKAGGGFAVEVVRDGGRRELVAVKLGLFDSAGGRVQVEGDLRVGDQVVIPAP